MSGSPVSVSDKYIAFRSTAQEASASAGFSGRGSALRIKYDLCNDGHVVGKVLHDLKLWDIANERSRRQRPYNVFKMHNLQFIERLEERDGPHVISSVTQVLQG